MFNVKEPDTDSCDAGSTVYHGDCNYMLCVTWDDFISKTGHYIDKCYEIQDNQDDYDIRKEI